jgi:hypothetical protein
MKRFAGSALGSAAAIVIALVGVSLALAPAAGGGKKKTYRATFMATIRGEVEMTWKRDDYLEFEDFGKDCEGTGIERVTFATPKPLKVKVTATSFPRPPLYRFPDRSHSFAVDARIERSATWTDNAGCPERQNCTGTAMSLWWLKLLPYTTTAQGEYLKADVSRNRADNVVDPFPDCKDRTPDIGTPPFFPELWNQDNSEEHIKIAVSPNRGKLFDPDVKRLSSQASGTWDSMDSIEGWRNFLSWKLTLRRVG